MEQHFAMSAPRVEEVPVMKAESPNDSTTDDSIRIALADISQHALLGPSGESEISENRYLATLSSSAYTKSVSTNPNSKTCPEPCQRIENTKLDDLDPIYTYDLNGNRTSMIDPTGLT